MCPSEVNDRPRMGGDIPIHYPINYGLNMGVWLVYDPAQKTAGAGAFFQSRESKNA